MRLFRLLFRLLMLLVGAFIGLGLFFVAVVCFLVFLLISLLRGRKPNLHFRVNPNPWAGRRPPAGAPSGDVVDIEVREVPDVADRREPAPLPPPPPRQD
jgi:hypothetical protein